MCGARNIEKTYHLKVYLHLHIPFTVIFYCFRMNLIYLTLVLHGIGILMPWNMIITAKEVRSYNITSGVHLEFNAHLCHCTIM